MNAFIATAAAAIPVPDTTGIVDGLVGHLTHAEVLPMLDLNPLHWLGDAAKEGAANAFTAMMMSLWSAALWLLQAVFKVLDKFTTPNLTDPGLHDLYAITLWASILVALIVGLGQLGLAAIRRDGRTLGTLVVGLVQYGAVVTGWFTVCGAMVLGCAGLTTGLLQALLEVNDFSGYAAGSGWVDQVSGTVEAAVLGVCALFMLIPAAFGYLIIMLVREAALLILTATLPIAAAGALSDGTRAWMWKAVRWFLAACLTSPLLALTLGLGVRIARAAFPDASNRPSTAPGAQATQLAATAAANASGVPDTAANIGMAVVGCVIMLVACFCPMALFRLLAFVDPGTGSGAAVRATMSANGGVAGLMRRHRPHEPHAGTATQSAPDGRSASETSADAETANRFQSRAARTIPAAGRVIGGTMTRIGSVAQHGAAAGADVISQAGLGHPSYHQPGPDTAPGGQQGKQPPRRHPGPAGSTAPASSPSASSAATPAPSPGHGQQQRGSDRTAHPAPPSPPSPPAGPATAPSAGPSVGPSAGPSAGSGGPGAGGQPTPAEVQAAVEEGAFLA